MSAGRSSTLRLLTSVAVVVLLAAGLVAVAVQASPSSSTAPEPRRAPPLNSSGAAPTTEPLPGTSLAGPGTLPAIEEIRRQVAALRGLKWKAPLKLEVVSKEELRRRVREVNARDVDPVEVAGEGETYKLLHVIPPDLDYPGTLDDLYAQLVAGFYDPVSKEMFVGDPGGERLEPWTRITIAHELDHALTDQHFDFGSRIEALEKGGRDEEVAAFIALVEGDAKFLESAWADEYLSEGEAVAALLGGGDVDFSAVARIPPYMIEVLMAPYARGLDFVSRLVDTGGLARLDAAYARPPTSTEQVIHPESYLANQGKGPSGPSERGAQGTPELPDLAAATGCQAVHRGTLGELEMGQVLQTAIDNDEAESAARGWNGDSFQVVRCGAALGMVERWQGDGAGDASRLAAALSEWSADWAGSGRRPDAAGRFAGDDGAGRVVQQGDRVDLVLADDQATADRLSAALG